MEWINENGELKKIAKQSIVNSRAFRYGDGFFETIRIKDSLPLNLIFHFNRIQSALKVLKLEGFPYLDSKSLEAVILEVLMQNGNPADASIRLQINRTGGGRYLPQSNSCDYLLECHTINYDIQTPASLLVYEEIMKPVNILSHFKMIGSHWNILAAIEAERNGFTDALLLNQEGLICETTHSNIFFEKDGIIYTPDLSSGCVDGTYRRHLLEEGKMKIVERKIHPKDLITFENAFCTNAIRGIIEVSKISYRKETIYFNEKQ